MFTFSSLSVAFALWAVVDVTGAFVPGFKPRPSLAAIFASGEDEENPPRPGSSRWFNNMQPSYHGSANFPASWLTSIEPASSSASSQLPHIRAEQPVEKRRSHLLNPDVSTSIRILQYSITGGEPSYPTHQPAEVLEHSRHQLALPEQYQKEAEVVGADETDQMSVEEVQIPPLTAVEPDIYLIPQAPLPRPEQQMMSFVSARQQNIQDGNLINYAEYKAHETVEHDKSRREFFAEQERMDQAKQEGDSQAKPSQLETGAEQHTQSHMNVERTQESEEAPLTDEMKRWISAAKRLEHLSLLRQKQKELFRKGKGKPLIDASQGEAERMDEEDEAGDDEEPNASANPSE